MEVDAAGEGCSFVAPFHDRIATVPWSYIMPASMTHPAPRVHNVMSLFQ